MLAFLPAFINIDESISFFFGHTGLVRTTGVDYSREYSLSIHKYSSAGILVCPTWRARTPVGAAGYRRNLISKLHANLTFDVIHFAGILATVTRGLFSRRKRGRRNVG